MDKAQTIINAVMLNIAFFSIRKLLWELQSTVWLLCVNKLFLCAKAKKHWQPTDQIKFKRLSCFQKTVTSTWVEFLAAIKLVTLAPCWNTVVMLHNWTNFCTTEYEAVKFVLWNGLNLCFYTLGTSIWQSH